VGDEVGHVERWAEVARDVGAEVEVDAASLVDRLFAAAPAFSTYTARSSGRVGLSSMSTTSAPWARDRIDHALERVAVDAVQGGGGRGGLVMRGKGEKKTRAPGWGPRVLQPPNWAAETNRRGANQAPLCSRVSFRGVRAAGALRSPGAGASRARRGGGGGAIAPLPVDDDELNAAISRPVARGDVRCDRRS